MTVYTYILGMCLVLLSVSHLIKANRGHLGLVCNQSTMELYFIQQKRTPAGMLSKGKHTKRRGEATANKQTVKECLPSQSTQAEVAASLHSMSRL